MFGNLQLKIGLAVLLCVWAIGTYSLIKSNITLHNQAQLAQQQLLDAQTKYIVTNQTLLNVEKAKDEEEKKTLNGLVEMSSKGHISTSHGDNPEWMRSK